MTRDFVQVGLGHEGSFRQLVATAFFLIFDKALQELDGACPFWQQDRQTLANVVDSREIANSRPSLLWSRFFASSCWSR